MLANAALLKRLRRAVVSRLRFPILESDIVDVVYMSWLVDMSRIRHLVPTGVEVWEHDGRTVLSILTYRHGHFGPAMAGPLRRIFSSPLQSNWRRYIESIHGAAPAQPTVLFLTNVIDHPLYALGARLMSDVLPSDLPRSMTLARRGDRIVVAIEPGRSHAPDLHLELRLAPPSETSALAFTTAFGDLDAATRWLFDQDAAVAPVPDIAGLALGEISIPINASLVVSLAADMTTFRSRFLSPLVGTDEPFCFLVKRGHFGVLSERLLT